jgi:hypothetical protein
MGAEYYYVNHDKLQYFSCGVADENSKFSGLGMGLGARALAILLSDRGTWEGDRISVVNDYSPMFLEIYQGYFDIQVEALLMLIDVDGLEWIDSELESSPSHFALACEIATYLKRRDVTHMLERKFGGGKWQERYNQHLKSDRTLRPREIAAASTRQLVTLLKPTAH